MTMAVATWLAVLVAAAAAAAAAPTTYYIIPHSHCDAGWIHTFEQYYVGKVATILPQIVAALSRDPRLRFNWAETGYLRRWWQDASAEQRVAFRDMVATGRIALVGGGWVQNDESVTARDAMIEQVLLGHAWLQDVFNATPRVAWQIDPFGHSNSHALVAAEVGYDAIVLDRVGWDTKVHLGKTRHLEFVWQPSASAPGTQTLDIFAHVLDVPLALYASPVSFDFESIPQLNPGVTEANIKDRAESLIAQLAVRAELFRRPHVLIPFGMDFRYQRAMWEFGNMSLLIDYINTNHGARFNLTYATLNDYFAALNADQGTGFPVLGQNSDFHPYSWTPYNEDSWWTGFYFARPCLKDLARRGDVVLHAASVAAFVARIWRPTANTTASARAIFDARQTSAFLTHHDAITGTAEVQNYFIDGSSLAYIISLFLFSMDCGLLTCQSHVVDWYTSLLNTSIASMRDVTAAMSTLILRNPNAVRSTPDLSADPTVLVNGLAQGVGVLVVYNAESRARTLLVTAPTPCATISNCGVAVRNSSDSVPSQLMPPRQGQDSNATVVFQAFLEPFAWATYFLSVADPKSPGAAVVPVVADCNEMQSPVLSNRLTTVVLDELCNIASVTDDTSGTSVKTSVNFLAYESNNDNAYIFRPRTTPAVPFARTSKPAFVIVGPLIQTVVSTYLQHGAEVETELRVELRAGQSEVFLHSSMPAPVAQSEVSLTVATNLSSGIISETDDNGMFVLQRRYSHADTLARNVYPATEQLTIRDASRSVGMALLFTGPKGATAVNGTSSLFMHRRLLNNPGLPPCGLPEALNDTCGISETFALLIAPSGVLNGTRRTVQRNLEHPLHTLYGAVKTSSDWLVNYAPSFVVGNSAAIDPTVVVGTLGSADSFHDENVSESEDPAVAVVVVHNTVQSDEGLSGPASIDFSAMFAPSFTVPDVQSRDLSIVRTYNATRMVWATDGGSSPTTLDPLLDSNDRITLAPMQSRAFLVRVARK